MTGKLGRTKTLAGNPRVPPPTREAAAMLMAPPPRSKEEVIVRYGQTWKILRAGSFPEEEALDLEQRVAVHVARVGGSLDLYGCVHVRPPGGWGRSGVRG